MKLLGFRFGRSEPDTPGIEISIPDQFTKKYNRAAEIVEMYKGGIIICEVVAGVCGTLAIIQDNVRLAFLTLPWIIGAVYCARRRNWWTQEVALIKENALAFEANRLEEPTP